MVRQYKLLMPEEHAFNRFINGIATDPHDSDRKNDSAIDLANIRIMNRGNQNVAESVKELVHAGGTTWVATNIKGMEVQFTLKTGYIPIGYTQYNGVGYIVSLNSTENRTEFGSFPHPVYDENGDCTGWNKDYKAFNNYVGEFDYNQFLYFKDDECDTQCDDLPLLPVGIASEFNIDNELTDFDCNYRQSIIPKQSYDGSVKSLYL